jgi:hypothetical protein
MKRAPLPCRGRKGRVRAPRLGANTVLEQAANAAVHRRAAVRCGHCRFLPSALPLGKSASTMSAGTYSARNAAKVASSVVTLFRAASVNASSAASSGAASEPDAERPDACCVHHRAREGGHCQVAARGRRRETMSAWRRAGISTGRRWRRFDRPQSGARAAPKVRQRPPQPRPAARQPALSPAHAPRARADAPDVRHRAAMARRRRSGGTGNAAATIVPDRSTSRAAEPDDRTLHSSCRVAWRHGATRMGSDCALTLT